MVEIQDCFGFFFNKNVFYSDVLKHCSYVYRDGESRKR